MPQLIKAELSADYLDPGDDLWVTTWWCNTGTPADRELCGFLDLEFGHQRIVETQPRTHRVLWQPFPGPQRWRHGETWATCCRWHVPAQNLWGGTYRLYIGFCDGQRTPVTCLDGDGTSQVRVAIGEVDVAWGWGKAAMQRVRHAVVREFPPPQSPAPAPTAKASPATIFPDAVVELPEGFALDLSTECAVRDLVADTVLHNYEQSCALELEHGHAAGRQGACLRRGGIAIAAWELVAETQADGLMLRLENVWEADGYELLEVRLPMLLSLSGEGANLVDFFADGRLVPVANSRPMVYEHPYDVRNAAALCGGSALAVLELSGLDDRLLAGVTEGPWGRRGVLGAVLTHRLAARGLIHSIAMHRAPELRIAFAYGELAAQSWQGAARLLRRGLTQAISELYRRTALYKIIISYGPDPDNLLVNEDSSYALRRLQTVNTFEQARCIVSSAYHLLGGCPQVVYLVGFQREGHDSGYPDVLTTHPRAGSLQEMRALLADGPQYNAIIGLHDNFDDAYNLDVLDPSLLAVDENGEPFRTWFWASGMSYVLSPAKYVDSGLAHRRVLDTVSHFGLGRSSHLDVLTSEVRRYDYDPENPLSSEDGLRGKREILAEFRRQGVDITSENLTHPFVGHIGLGLWTRYRRDAALFPGEQDIPLVPMIYHGVIQYCCAGTSKTEMLEGMLRGAVHTWGDVFELTDDHIRAFYLQTLPMGLLYGRSIESVEQRGAERTLRFGDDTYINGNLDTLRYEIVVDGRLVSCDWATFAPGFRDGEWLAYTADGGSLDFPAPPGWTDGITLEARLLTPNGEGEAVPCTVEGNRLVLALPVALPAVVRRWAR